tara:strand:- start:4294 stop:4785 length:492 start_codon:yes stop_codon:yes gene_type:complete
MIHPDDMPDRIPANDEPFSDYDDEVTYSYLEDRYYEEKSIEELENLVDYKGGVYGGLRQYGADTWNSHKTVMVTESIHSGLKHIHRLDIPLSVFKERLASTEKPEVEIPFIQDLFPELDSTQREALLTGVSDSEWCDLWSNSETTSHTFMKGNQYPKSPENKV